VFQRVVLPDADRLQPGAAGQAEVGAAAADRVERGEPARDLVGCWVYGLRQAAPSRTREVARAISSRAGSGGWSSRSANTLTTSKP
jgi:hypothetical protein